MTGDAVNPRHGYDLGMVQMAAPFIPWFERIGWCQKIKDLPSPEDDSLALTHNLLGVWVDLGVNDLPRSHQRIQHHDNPRLSSMPHHSA